MSGLYEEEKAEEGKAATIINNSKLGWRKLA
jgi:hypothetical protein